MIICNECNVVVTKTTFCSDKCRVKNHRKTIETIQTSSNGIVTTADKIRKQEEPRFINIDKEDIASDEIKVNMSRCQAPNTTCRSSGSKYLVGFMTDEGLKYKSIHLCATHLQKARNECESVEEA